MAIAYFTSVGNAEAIEVIFAKSAGGEATLRLLVDSGFTGQRCFVLPDSANYLAQAPASASQAAGALHGIQKRVVVSFRIAAISFKGAAIAILADTSVLTLPSGIDGLVGLRFLRYFRRWGAEQIAGGAWRFFLETNTT